MGPYQDIHCSSNLEYYFSTDFNLILGVSKTSKVCKCVNAPLVKNACCDCYLEWLLLTKFVVLICVCRTGNTLAPPQHLSSLADGTEFFLSSRFWSEGCS